MNHRLLNPIGTVFFALLLCLSVGCYREANSQSPSENPGGTKAGVEVTSRPFHTSRKNYRPLALPDEETRFTFAILGDRTGGRVQGLRFLRETVRDLNIIRPDLVMTVGDLIQGYTTSKKWLFQMKRYKKIMNHLKMPWFPVAGNHDIYWRGKNRPPFAHERNYEKHFGPLWYAFEHRNCWFVVLYSDEGNLQTGKKGYRQSKRQKMSKRQKKWLQEVLKKARRAEHVFVFLHHPRWLGRMSSRWSYGKDWQNVHKMLKEAGNVTAVFAGHIHQMTYGGEKDGIEYFTTAGTGAHLRGQDPPRGLKHHYFLVTVRKEKIAVSSHPTGEVIDPRTMPARPLNLSDFKGIQTLKSEKFHIIGAKRRDLRWKIDIPSGQKGKKGHQYLLIAIEGAADDTGDRGLNFRLLDQSGEAVRQRKIWRKGKFWIRKEVKPGSQWTLVLSDGDTSLTGRHPGNAGKVTILLAR